MDKRQVLLRDVRIATLRDLREPVALLGEVVVARPVVGCDASTRLHRVKNEALQRFRRAVRSDVETQAPSVEATSARKCLAGIPFPLILFALALLDRANDNCLVMLSSPLAARPAPDQRLIDLDREVTSYAVTIRAHHRYAEFVQNLEGCLVAIQAELPLELHSAHAGGLARHEVCGPKPDRDRRMCALHDRVGCERRVTLTVATSKHDGGSVREAARLAMPTTVLAGEAFWPSDLLQVRRTRCVIREKPHEVRERRRERKIAEHNGEIIADSRLGSNRISTEGTMTAFQSNPKEQLPKKRK